MSHLTYSTVPPQENVYFVYLILSKRWKASWNLRQHASGACKSLTTHFYMYFDWTRSKTREGSTRSTGGSYKAWRQSEQIRLSTDPVFSQYEIYGSRQCCSVHKTLANGPHTHTHTPQIYGSKSAWHTQDLIITLQLKMCPSVSILSLIW